MTPAAGETLGGRYEIRERAGSGGFSTVWRAVDTETGDQVALKCPDTETQGSGTVFEGFRREIAALEPFADAITPAGLVRFLDHDAGATTPFVAFEYLPGESLSEALGTGSLGSSVRRRVVAELAVVLDFLHRNDVLYLDLKPENVVLRSSGSPVLIDFNTAVRGTGSVERLFEPDPYKAPELLRDGDADAQAGTYSDVYAWGKLAFYLLTGARVETERVPEDGLDPRNFGSSCDAALASVVRRATAPDPDRRPADGPSLRAAVADATNAGPTVLVRHTASGVACPVASEDTIGRLASDAPVPSVVVPDPERHVSPEHVRLRRTGDGWVVADTSLNGTYVGPPDDLTFVLSEAGHERRSGGTADGDEPPRAVRVAPGHAIRPVHPEYGIELRLEPAADSG